MSQPTELQLNYLRSRQDSTASLYVASAADQLLSASRNNKLSFFKSILYKIVYYDNGPLFDTSNDQPSVMHQIFREPHNSEFIREVFEFGRNLNILQRIVAETEATKPTIYYIIESNDMENFRVFMDCFTKFCSVKEFKLMAILLEQFLKYKGQQIMGYIYGILDDSNFDCWVNILKIIPAMIQTFKKVLCLKYDLSMDMLLELQNKAIVQRILLILVEFISENSENYQTFRKRIMNHSSLLALHINVIENKHDQFQGNFINYTASSHTNLQNDCNKLISICLKQENEPFLRTIFACNEFDIGKITEGNLLQKMCYRGHAAIVEVLLKRNDVVFDVIEDRDGNPRTILNDCIKGNSWRGLKRNDKLGVNYERCINLVLDDERFNYYINKENYDPLHTAIKSNFAHAVIKLIEKGHNITEEHITNMEYQTLESILDQQVCCLSKDLKLIVKYNILQQQSPPIMQMDILRYISKTKSLQCLGKHPVLKLFLDAKNHQYRMLNWMIFLIVITSFLIMMPSFFITLYDDDTIEVKKSKNTRKFLFQFPFMVVITLLELIRLFSWRNFKSTSSWLSIFLIVSTVGLFATTQYEEYHRIFTAIVLLLTTFKILALINMLCDSFAVHTMLCLIVAKTFMKVFAIHLPILIAFGCSFYVIFADTSRSTKNLTNAEVLSDDEYQNKFNNFKHFYGSILKTLVMFSGEFDASAMNLVESWYKVILFLCFLMTQVVIYNLANALAINDVEKLREDTEILANKQMIMKISRYEALTRNIRCCRNLEIRKLSIKKGKRKGTYELVEVPNYLISEKVYAKLKKLAKQCEVRRGTMRKAFMTDF